MLKDGVECCDECGIPLPGCDGRVLDDELLCRRCYQERSRSLRWFATEFIADGFLCTVAAVGFVVLLLFVPVVVLMKILLFGLFLYVLILWRPHVLGMVKDVLMRRKAIR